MQTGMNTTQPAPARSPAGLDYRAMQGRQRALWGAGDFSIIGSKIAVVSELLCEAIDLQAGEQVLDVACGHGNTALAAARRSALPTGLDLVPALLVRARERAAAERLEVEWKEGDAQDLPYDDEAFDVVLSTFGVMFAPDQPLAARELLRVCRAAGRIGLACWTPASFPGEMFKVIGRHVPPPAGAVPPFRWGTEDGLTALLGDGVTGLRAERRLCQMRFLSAEHYLEVFRTWFGPVRTAFGALGVEQQASMADDLLALARRFDRSGGGSLVLPAEYLEVVATRR